MMVTTMDQLNEEFQRNPQASSGRLRLDHYLVLEATNEIADYFLSALESPGILPFTVTWVSEAGWKVRLFLNPFEHSNMLNIPYNLCGMQFRFGSGKDCLVVNAADSILDREVGVLSEDAMQLFRIWQSFADTVEACLGRPLE